MGQARYPYVEQPLDPKVVRQGVDEAGTSVQSVTGSAVNNADPRRPVINSTAGSPYPEGAAFPATPAANDKFYRTDLNLLCYYDGTRWLSCIEYRASPEGSDYLQPLVSSSSSGFSIGRWSLADEGSILLTKLVVTTYSSTASSTNKWDFQLSRRNSTNTATDVGANTSTGADTVNTWINHAQVLNVVIPSTTYELQLVATKTGSAVTYALPRIHYRLIVT